jgi:hypothetical protein
MNVAIKVIFVETAGKRKGQTLSIRSHRPEKLLASELGDRGQQNRHFCVNDHHHELAQERTLPNDASLLSPRRLFPSAHFSNVAVPIFL